MKANEEKKQALAAMKVLQAKFDKACEDAWRTRTADAGFDGGEFSGPAHDRTDRDFLDPLEFDVEAAHILYGAKEYGPVVAYAAGALSREALYAAANKHQDRMGPENWHMAIWS